MAIALHHSRAKGTTKLVLLGIANHDGDGGAWPSMATLAKYGGVTTDAARKHVRRLEALHEIAVLLQGGGTMETADHMRPNLYKFLLECPPSCDGSKNHRMRNQLLRTPEFELSTPPANPLAPIGPKLSTPPANRLAEPSLTNQHLTNNSHLPKRAHAREARAAHTSPYGRMCQGQLLDDRHCEFGCIVETPDHQTSGI